MSARTFATLALVFLAAAGLWATPGPRYSTITEAIARGDLADVKLHLAADPSRRDGAKDAPLTPLHEAILRNRTEIAVLLLDAGADPNRTDSSQRTPLHLAVERGNLPLVETLLRRKVRPDELDRTGWTPLHHAAAKNQVAIARALLAGGANPKALSARGGTPLHEAAASSGAEMVKLLLAAGVDPAVVSQLGVTARDVAREFKNEAAIAILAARSGATR